MLKSDLSISSHNTQAVKVLGIPGGTEPRFHWNVNFFTTSLFCELLLLEHRLHVLLLVLLLFSATVTELASLGSHIVYSHRALFDDE